MSQEQGRLSVREVCAILRTCSRHKIRSFKYDGLEVVFGDSSLDNSIQATSPKTVEAVGRLAEEGRARQLLMSREDELALLAVEDPVSYERHLLSEDAESEDDPPPDE